MSIIVEDGTMPAGANAYASLAEADAYLVQRGIWPLTPDVLNNDGLTVKDPAVIAKKEQLIIRSTDWLNTQRWRGASTDWQRVMAWPRIGIKLSDLGDAIVPETVVPNAVKQACIELAGLMYGGTDPLAVRERNGVITSYSESVTGASVDVITEAGKSVSTTYAQGVSPEAYYPAVAPLIEPFLAVVPGKRSSVGFVEVGRG